MELKTPQEAFWAGPFGAEYRHRNGHNESAHASNVAFFSRSLRVSSGIASIIEFGANIGLNIHALRTIMPQALLSAIEINSESFAQLAPLCNGEVIHGSILDAQPNRTYDLAFTKCVLIHIPPDQLDPVYTKLYECSRRYILIAEYYNPVPVSIPYRGHEDRLFKRDFAGEILDRYPNLRLVDYGFTYSRDPNHPQDDITWFLLEKPFTRD